MITRRDILKCGLATLTVPYIGRGEPRRSMLGACNVVEESEAELVNPYIQNGLEVMFDGIWNINWGNHDPTTKKWYDLKGSGRYFHIESAYSDCVSFTGSNNLKAENGGDVGFSADHDLTLTAVVTAPKSISWQVQSMIALGRDSFSKNGFVLGGLAGYSNVQAFWGEQYSGGTRYIVDTGFGASSRFAYSVVFYYDALQFEIYINGFKVGNTQTISPTVWNLDGMTDLRLAMGANSGALNDTTGFRLHNVLLYSRPLSDEEITHNYLIDKERFGIM